ncbi:MAG: hypothetical protein HY840_03155, partial [Bacteroidetes bacterium]|nr:hypothetical protein [Bacteroidota bacterium]
MPSTSESGHAKNVASFSKLLVGVQSYGASYAPSAPEIAATALQTKNAALDPVIQSVTNAVSPHKNAVNVRQAAFNPMSKLVTRMENALKGCGAAKKEITDGIGFAKKIKGERIDTKHALDAFIDSTHKAGTPVDSTPTTDVTHDELIEHSVSQMSFDNRIQNFKKLVSFLSGITKYNPNEADLKIAALTTYANSLQPLNNAVNTAFITLYKARTNRDKQLYAEGTGAHDLLQQTKYYVKSAYGPQSP